VRGEAVLSEPCGEDADEAGGAHWSDFSANCVHHVGRLLSSIGVARYRALATIAKAADPDQGPHAALRHELGIGSVTVANRATPMPTWPAPRSAL